MNYFAAALTIFLILFSDSGRAQVVTVDENTTEVSLEGIIQLYATTDQLDITDSIQIRQNQKSVNRKNVDFKLNQYGFLEIQNQTDEHRVVYFSLSDVDTIIVNTINSSGKFDQMMSGVLIPYENKNSKAGAWKDNYIKMDVGANEQLTVFLAIPAMKGNRRFYPKLISNYSLTRQVADQQFTQGVYQGVMLIICTFAIILFVARKRKVHLYYALFVFGLYIAYLPVFGFSKGLTGSYSGDFIVYSIISQLAALCYFHFFRYSVNTQRDHPKLDQLVKYLIYVRVVTGAIGLIHPLLGFGQTLVVTSINIADGISLIVGGYVIVKILLHGDRFVRFILVSTITLMVALFLTIMSQLLHWDIYHNYFLQGGIVIQNLVLSLGLGYLVKSRFEQEIAKRQDDMSQQMQINLQLEQQVNLRTRALENQKDFIQKIIDEMPNHVFVRNSQGNYKIVNRAFADYYGKRKEDFIGKSILETHPDFGQAQKYLKEDQMVLSQDMKVSDEYLMDPLTGKWVYFYKVPFKLGRKSYVLCMEIDITDIKQTSNKLKKTNKELNKAIDHLHQAQSEIIQKEKMAVLGRLSAGIAHEINTPLGVIKGSVDYLIESFPDIGDIINTINEKIPTEHREAILSSVNKAAESYRFLTSSEERQLVKDLSAKMESDGVENAKHLAELSLHLDVEKDYDKLLPIWKLPDSEEIFEAIQLLFFRFNSVFNIKNAMEKANKILFAIKSYTHFKNEGLFKPVDLRKNIENVLIMFENILKTGIEVEFDVQKDAMIYGLPDELGQVWTNLISNAVHAMDKQGRLKIACAEHDSHYLISIEDNGSGIPVELQGKIFEPFFTTKSAGHGSGLGLDIIKRIVEKHSGDISFKSEPGKTVFFVKLQKELKAVTVEEV